MHLLHAPVQVFLPRCRILNLIFFLGGAVLFTLQKVLGLILESSLGAFVQVPSETNVT